MNRVCGECGSADDAQRSGSAQAAGAPRETARGMFGAIGLGTESLALIHVERMGAHVMTLVEACIRTPYPGIEGGVGDRAGNATSAHARSDSPGTGHTLLHAPSGVAVSLADLEPRVVHTER